MTPTRANPGVEQVAELLEAGPLSRLFTWEQLTELAKWVTVRHHAAGSRIFEEGDRESYMAIVAAGRVSVVKAAAGVESRIAVIGPGQTLGEMSLIDGEPRSAGAVADGDVTLLVVTKERFDTLGERVPALGQKLVLYVARLLSQRLRLASGKLVESIGGSGH